VRRWEERSRERGGCDELGGALGDGRARPADDTEGRRDLARARSRGSGVSGLGSLAADGVLRLVVVVIIKEIVGNRGGRGVARHGCGLIGSSCVGSDDGDRGGGGLRRGVVVAVVKETRDNFGG